MAVIEHMTVSDAKKIVDISVSGTVVGQAVIGSPATWTGALEQDASMAVTFTFPHGLEPAAMVEFRFHVELRSGTPPDLIIQDSIDRLRWIEADLESKVASVTLVRDTLDLASTKKEE